MIAELEERIRSAFDFAVRHEVYECQPNILRSLENVQKCYGGQGAQMSASKVEDSIQAYLQTGQLATVSMAKYVCFGVSHALTTTGRRLIDDGNVLRNLLGVVESLSNNSRIFLKCYQGLLASYFSYEHVDGTDDNHLVLRDFLKSQLTFLAGLTQLPSWCEVLLNHSNVLSDSPCARYVDENGFLDQDTFNRVCSDLCIMPDSWLKERAILDQFIKVSTFYDDKFKNRLDDYLCLIENNGLGRYSDRLRIAAVCVILTRYADCSISPEHLKLKNIAIRLLGDPWLNLTAWMAHLGDDKPRAMVDGWVKRQLISDFFMLLSQAGAANKRRLDYWLRFQPVLEDVCFILGDDAMSRTGEHFDRFREDAVGRIKCLTEDPNSLNNAFILFFKDIVVVEFGLTGNACFFYSRGTIPFDMERRSLSVSILKSLNRYSSLGTKKTHQGNWEMAFDDYFCRQIGWWPSLAASSNILADIGSGQVRSKVRSYVKNHDEHFTVDKLNNFAAKYGLDVQDHRSIGGAIWINSKDKFNQVYGQLSKWGFRYKENGQWWKD